MKVVLFCGGLGTRLRDYAQTVPKPLVPIGLRPVLWHLMKYYAHFGHKEFILCLGYKGDMIKEYFLNYNECVSNDFVMSNGGHDVELFNSDIQDWQITFVDTGLNSNIGQRLKAIEHLIGDDEIFMANYSDGLSDLDLDKHLSKFRKSQLSANFLSVRMPQSFHTVLLDESQTIKRIEPIKTMNIWVNGGYFIFRKSIFDYIKEGEELVEMPFQRLIKSNQIMTSKHKGFWKPLDTFKDKIEFDQMVSNGITPWKLWEKKEGDD